MPGSGRSACATRVGLAGGNELGKFRQIDIAAADDGQHLTASTLAGKSGVAKSYFSPREITLERQDKPG